MKGPSIFLRAEKMLACHGKRQLKWSPTIRGPESSASTTLAFLIRGSAGPTARRAAARLCLRCAPMESPSPLSMGKLSDGSATRRLLAAILKKSMAQILNRIIRARASPSPSNLNLGLGSLPRLDHVHHIGDLPKTGEAEGPLARALDEPLAKRSSGRL